MIEESLALRNHFRHAFKRHPELSLVMTLGFSALLWTAPWDSGTKRSKKLLSYYRTLLVLPRVNSNNPSDFEGPEILGLQHSVRCTAAPAATKGSMTAPLYSRKRSFLEVQVF
jgi:hypothetical protein